MQRRIDVVFPTSFQQQKTTSLQRRIDVMLETMLKSGWNRVAIALKSRWNYDVETNFIWNLFSTSFQRQFAIFQRRFNVETTSLCLLGWAIKKKNQ